MRWLISSMGWRRPSGRRPVGRVTSTASSVRMRSSRSASSSAWRAENACATRALAEPTRLPASALALGGSAPISRLAIARALLSPWWALAGGLELVERGRCGGSGERFGDGILDGPGVECGDLDGVVAGVGSRHGVHFGRGWGAPESRWVARRGRTRSGPRAAGGTAQMPCRRRRSARAADRARGPGKSARSDGHPTSVASRARSIIRVTVAPTRWRAPAVDGSVTDGQAAGPRAPSPAPGWRPVLPPRRGARRARRRRTRHPHRSGRWRCRRSAHRARRRS